MAHAARRSHHQEENPEREPKKSKRHQAQKQRNPLQQYGMPLHVGKLENKAADVLLSQDVVFAGCLIRRHGLVDVNRWSKLLRS